MSEVQETFEWWYFAYWQTLCRQTHKEVFSSYTIRTIAELEKRLIIIDDVRYGARIP
jgi:hypothetical protein